VSKLSSLISIEADLSRSTAPRGVMMWLLISLGGLGLLLSALGVYAVLVYAVVRRTREVGIRMAMGASRSRIRGLFFRHGVRLVANGLVLGIAAAITTGVYMESLLYGVKPTDPWAFAAVALTLGVVGGIACWLPARRAARVDPVKALRMNDELKPYLQPPLDSILDDYELAKPGTVVPPNPGSPNSERAINWAMIEKGAANRDASVHADKDYDHFIIIYRGGWFAYGPN